MTRINADIDPKVLMDQHLMAEYRELPMVPAALRRSLRSKSINDVKARIPKEFTLGKGHVTFWYDKLGFLDDRYHRLRLELIARGFKIDPNRSSGVSGFPDVFYGKYQMTSKDECLILARIEKRISEKPTWYRKTEY